VPSASTSGGVTDAPKSSSGYTRLSTPSVSADLPMSLLSVFSNYWHRFIISDAFINYLANPVYYVSVFPLSYFYQHSSEVYQTCSNGNANCNDAMYRREGGGNQSC